MLAGLILLVASLALAANAQDSGPKQLCCPQSVLQDYIDTAGTTDLKSTSIDPDGNLVCWYDGIGFHGLENPFCKYTPVERKRLVHNSYVTIPAGRSLGGGELGCDGYAPERQAGKGPCTSSVCCPHETSGGMKLQDAKFEVVDSQDVIRCSYEVSTLCEYYLDDGSFTADQKNDTCPPKALTAETCIVRT